jgi:hypothetical protein
MPPAPSRPHAERRNPPTPPASISNRVIVCLLAQLNRSMTGPNCPRPAGAVFGTGFMVKFVHPAMLTR